MPYTVRPIAEEEASFWSGDVGWRLTSYEEHGVVHACIPEDLFDEWKPPTEVFYSMGHRHTQYVEKPIEWFTFEQYANSWFWYMGYYDECCEALEKRFHTGYFRGIESPHPSKSHECFLYNTLPSTAWGNNLG